MIDYNEKNMNSASAGWGRSSAKALDRITKKRTAQALEVEEQRKALEKTTQTTRTKKHSTKQKKKTQKNVNVLKKMLKPIFSNFNHPKT